MSPQLTQAGFKYVRGPATARTLPRFETKPTYVEKETFKGGERTAIVNTGGSYEHWRTTEQGKEVYVSHHRLFAIARNLQHEETDEPLLDEDNREGVIDTSVLDGVDVHHAAPELPPGEASKTFGWDTREESLSWVEHGRHSGITQAEKLAYAKDGQRVRDGQVQLDTEQMCSQTGCVEPVKASIGEEGYCMEHAKKRAEVTGETVEIESAQ